MALLAPAESRPARRRSARSERPARGPGLYARAGYVGAAFVEAGIDHVGMEKRLPEVRVDPLRG